MTGQVSLASSGKGHSDSMEVWITTGDRSRELERQPVRIALGTTVPGQPTLRMDNSIRFQTVDGFGYTLTGGSALLIGRMTDKARTALLSELFMKEGNGIGISYLRVSMGASDLDPSVFSYDDLPPGRTDTALSAFSLSRDTLALIQLLK